MHPQILPAAISLLVMTAVDVYSVNMGNDALARVCENRLQPASALFTIRYVPEWCEYRLIRCLRQVSVMQPYCHSPI
jgi:hypothetical protein